jgi:hypothetical protein
MDAVAPLAPAVELEARHNRKVVLGTALAAFERMQAAFEAELTRRDLAALASRA